MAQTSIPIVAYHQVRPGGRMTPARLDEHLRALSARGWETITPDDVLAFLGGGPPPRRRRACLLTFDDGYLDFWIHAFPLLRAHGARATVYLITGRSGGPGPPRALPEAAGEIRTGWELNNHASLNPGPAPGFLNAAEITAMAGSGLVTFGAHSHLHLPAWVSGRAAGRLDGRPEWWLESVLGRKPRQGETLHRWNAALACERWIPPGNGGRGHLETVDERRARVLEELEVSGAAFAQSLGAAPRHFAYPWGRYDDLLVDCLRASGYRTAATLDRGANARGDDPLKLARFDAKGHGGRWLLARLALHARALPARVYGAVSGRRGGAAAIRP